MKLLVMPAGTALVRAGAARGYLHLCPGPGGFRHLDVGGDQRNLQGVREHHVSGVVGREVVSQVKDVAERVGPLMPFDSPRR